MEKLMFALRFI